MQLKISKKNRIEINPPLYQHLPKEIDIMKNESFKRLVAPSK